MKIIDCITFNNEHDLFELRYRILKDYVDEFIVIEFDKTFSGTPKNPQFVKFYPKIKYFFIKEDQYIKYKELAESSPNTQGAEHWKREFMQKESIKDCLTDLQDDDIVFIGDCDEIWDSRVLKNYTGTPCKLSLRVYIYYLNNRSSEEFFGIFLSPYGYIKEKCLNHLRTNAYKCASYFYDGWHFTSLKDGLEKKLTDSYTEESYATPQVMSNLKENIENNRDFLGRDFKFQVDESDWPEYLKIHRSEFAHLLK